MKMVYMNEDDEVRSFARIAAQYFARNDKITTFTSGDVEASCLFAVRWGMSGDCVVVFRLDEDFEPINYQQLIREYEVE